MIKFILSVSFILPDINKQYLPTRRQPFSFFYHLTLTTNNKHKNSGRHMPSNGC